MSQYTYLIAAESGDETLHVFSCKYGWKADTGDYITYDGEIFQVKKVIYVSTETEEYRLISELTVVRAVDCIFRKAWSKDDPEDG